MAKARKDNKGRALLKGESQRTQDNRYVYTYTNPDGKRKYLYATTLQELREKEKLLMRDQLDGLDVYAAGWVTRINSRNVILLGIEKILELKWYDEDAMYGLIYHELGHVYHKQYGTFYQNSDDSNRNFVWQLFAEGIAMYFEQLIKIKQDDIYQEFLIFYNKNCN